MVRQRHFDKNCVCPWWLVWTFDNPLRRLLHPPEHILGPFVRTGSIAADIGCGRGHFTLGLARLVGADGRVWAIDVQPRMLEMTARRVRREGLSDRVTTVLTGPQAPDLPEKADFILLSWMLHEVPDRDAFLHSLLAGVADDGSLLLLEPVLHVSRKEFESELASAERQGWSVSARPRIRLSHSALLTR